MTYYKSIANFIDIQVEFNRVMNCQKKMSLVECVKQLLRAQICKGEQISNWTRRPLRQSQMHYAAMDSFCLINLYKEMAVRAKKKNITLRPKPLNLKLGKGQDGKRQET